MVAFPYHLATATTSALACYAVTPSDTVPLPHGMCKALYIGTTGNVTLIDSLGNTCAFVALPAGTILPVFCSQVNATGTGASNIVALY